MGVDGDLLKYDFSEFLWQGRKLCGKAITNAFLLPLQIYPEKAHNFIAFSRFSRLNLFMLFMGAF